MSTADGRAERLCALESAVGAATVCPADACPFWDSGLAEAGCVLDDATIALQAPHVARELLALRNRLLELWPSEHPPARSVEA